MSDCSDRAGRPRPDLRFHDTVEPCLQRLRERGSPLIAFGQTVFWDEPVKAMLCIALSRYAPELRIIAGVHDADYFSKTHGHVRRSRRFEILAHDEGATHELWAAIAEASALFGGEVLVERQALSAAGVPIHRLAARHPKGRDAFFEEHTRAFGWRGIACLSGGDTVACDVGTEEIAGSLIELMRWALDESVKCVADPGAPQRADALLAEIREAGRRVTGRDPNASLTELYRSLLPRFYELLLQRPPCLLDVISSIDYFRFNRASWGRPRFEVLDRFLGPDTASVWREAYDRVVAGTGIYTLDRFGEGAIPFDLVLPERGRGTVRVLGPRLMVELPGGPVESECDEPITCREALAAAVEEAVGSAAAIVGKAIALPTMFCREGAMLLHEGASGYVRLTRQVVRELAEAGDRMELHPIVRLHHATWDALAETDVELSLPPHLAAALGKPVVSGAEFARQWRGAMDAAFAVLSELEDARKPDEVAEILGRRDGALAALLPAYSAARARKREIGLRIQALRDEHDVTLRQARRLRRGGPAGRAAARASEEKCAELRRQVREIMQSEEHRAAHSACDEALYAIQLAQLRAVRDAYYVLALEHANHRPSWWWFPLVDPTGSWFCQAAERAELYLEEMSG